MSEYTIYIVEDEEHLVSVLKAYLEKEGWLVKVFHDGETALRHVDDRPHLWVLDIMLPGVDGYEILKTIRSKTDTPVIFTSARDQDLDRIIGLELGSDDYLSKPFLPKELVIRVRKLLERVYEGPKTKLQVRSVNGYQIHPITRKISLGDELIELTAKELDVVLFLTEHVDEIKSRRDILEGVWGSDYFGSERAVDDVIRRIRKKMPRLNLETLYGGGYRIVSS
ncbi:response regulator transcription factor [Alkalihalobacillus sp. AL-G]|uniref:response regulator transcription factor n=1 Tax=Alkalihalobacillus sp. AL-G TaxID=2926399 RepID=UPI00272C1D73|nr:response regulator transcription factor [Alkalihalobacillus sp. AL-G]WLD94066.1 response regulator transcription factor [Alkalihalobacillus sp. AL-G]